MYRGSDRLKRKPMLFKKYLGKTNYEEKRTIGIIGANRGAGATYTGMLLAYYFGAEKRIKTAFLECNNHMDFERLQKTYEWSKEDGRSFSLDRITWYKQVTCDEVSGIFSDDYGCYILDFGTDLISWKDEFLRCGTKIIIGDRAIWNQCKMADFLSSLENIKGSRKWIYMIPYAGKRVLTGMSYKTDRDFIKVPYEPDPALLSRETLKLFQGLFG